MIKITNTRTRGSEPTFDPFVQTQMACKYTLDQLIANKDHEKIGDMAYIAAHLKEKGFKGDYQMRYNTMHQAGHILAHLSNIGGEDLVWLSNRLASVYQKGTYECIDNWRMCAGSMPDYDYREAQAQGCCGFYDNVFDNPKTGNSFCVGFNHGH